MSENGQSLPHPYYKADQQVGVPGKLFDPKLIARIVLSMLRRRIFLLLLAGPVAAGIGVVCSKPLKKEVWKSTALMLYTPPTVPEEVGSLEASFALTNVSGFATCRPVLNKIKENLGLQFPVALLSSSIKVETSRNSSTVFMSLNWGDKSEANQIMEQMTIVYPEHVAELRQSICDGMLKEVEAQITATKARHAAARTRFRDFTRENNIVDFKTDLTMLQTKVLDLETRYSRAKRDEQAMNDQVKLLEKHINNVRKEEEAESAANSEFEAAEESLADNRRRQNRLRELITEERRMLDMEAQIKVKRQEYERAKVLAEKQLISNSQFESIRGELESMIAKITESDSITKWKTELLELDKLVVPKNKKSKKGSPIIQQILFKKLETQLNIAQSQKTQIEIDNELKLARRQIETFQRLRNELATLEDDILNIGNEREELEGRASTIRSLASLGATEFSVVSPVSTGEFAISSNRGKMTVMITMVVMLLAGATIAGYDVLLCGIIPMDAQVQLMGLPVISQFVVEEEDEEEEEEIDGDEYDDEDEESDLQSQEIGSEEPADEQISDSEEAMDSPTEENEEVTEPPLSSQKPSHPAMRLLALQIRQRLEMAGAITMFSEISEAESFPMMIQELSRCFSGRDERVLIIDSRNAMDGLGDFASMIDRECLLEQLTEKEDVERDCLLGLRDWLAFCADDIDSIILPSNIAAVDLILPGRSRNPEELLTIRMGTLMEYVQKQYTMIILLSPDSTRTTELQALSAYADSIAFVFNHDEPINPQTKASIRCLKTIEAPMIGAVQL